VTIVSFRDDRVVSAWRSTAKEDKRITAQCVEQLRRANQLQVLSADVNETRAAAALHVERTKLCVLHVSTAVASPLSLSLSLSLSSPLLSFSLTQFHCPSLRACCSV
jgi:hypothetical protein